MPRCIHHYVKNALHLQADAAPEQAAGIPLFRSVKRSRACMAVRRTGISASAMWAHSCTFITTKRAGKAKAMAGIISNHCHSVQSPYVQHLMKQRFRSCPTRSGGVHKADAAVVADRPRRAADARPIAMRSADAAAAAGWPRRAADGRPIGMRSADAADAACRPHALHALVSSGCDCFMRSGTEQALGVAERVGLRALCR
jgi:hypothetical protein